MSDLYARDSVASLKSRELVNKTQRQAGSIDPNNLNETDEIIMYVLVLHITSKPLQELSFAPIGKPQVMHLLPSTSSQPLEEMPIAST
jgi:hypothetical protein